MYKTTSMNFSDVLKRYSEEDIPTFGGKRLTDVNQVGSDGDRPLHKASIRGNIADAVALIVGHADVNAAGEMGYTPLQYAVTFDHPELVSALIAHGAKDEFTNEFGINARTIAKQKSLEDILQLLEANFGKNAV